jgi:hypothetical protein
MHAKRGTWDTQFGPLLGLQMRVWTVLKQRAALLPVGVGGKIWVWSRQLPNKHIFQRAQRVRRVTTVKLQHGSGRVVIHVCVRNIGRSTGIGVYISRCREDATHKLSTAMFSLVK